MNEKEVLRKIWKKGVALRENAIEMPEPELLWKELLEMLEKLPSESIHFLRYKKLKKSKKWAWYRNNDGYPIGNPWNDMFEPFLKIFEQYQADKTLKNRFESEHLFIESRIQGEEGDQHILIGEKNGDSNKIHLVIDGETAEIRIEDKNHQQPEELLDKIETILTLKNGKKILTTREVIEEI